MAPNPAGCSQLAALYYAGRYAELESQARLLVEQYPDSGFAWKVLGVALQAQGNDALPAMKKAAELLPDDAEAHSNLGIALQYIGQLDDAVASYHRALEIDPDYAEAHYNLGNALRGIRQLDGAEASYRRALEIRPDYAEAHSNLGCALRGLGQLDDAEASFRRALEIRPDYAEAHNNLGIILMDMGRLGEAETCCRRALEIKSDYADAHSNLGNALRGLRQPDDAEACYRRALGIKPDYAMAHYNLGVVLEDVGQLDGAVASYRRALEIEPDYAEALLNLGYLLWDLDDLDQAAVVSQKAFDIDLANIGLDAAVFLAILHYLGGDIEQCRSRLLESQPVMLKAGLKYEYIRTYWCYLDRLLSWQQQSDQKDNQIQGLKTLHAIGESHSLSAHGVVVRYNGQEMRCSAEWISGCKQWHLGNAKPNKYKHKFEAVMARLPRESAILLLIGEIDCRHDEGILKALEKNPDKTLAEIVQSTAGAYIDYVTAIGGRYGHRVIVGGVPATHVPLDALTAGEAGQLVHLIRIFNATLKGLALAEGMGFLDVYALTDRGDGIASGEWHIDDIHLLPGAVAEAFDRYCIVHQ